MPEEAGWVKQINSYEKDGEGAYPINESNPKMLTITMVRAKTSMVFMVVEGSFCLLIKVFFDGFQAFREVKLAFMAL